MAENNILRRGLPVEGLGRSRPLAFSEGSSIDAHTTILPYERDSAAQGSLKLTSMKFANGTWGSWWAKQTARRLARIVHSSTHIELPRP